MFSIFSTILGLLDPKIVEHIEGTGDDLMVGAGVRHNGKTYITHTNLHHEHSAIKTVYWWQLLVIVGVIISIITGLLFDPIHIAIVLVGIITFIYFVDVFFNGFLILKSLHFPPEINASERTLKLLDKEDLPIYTILCPLYKESSVLPHFVENISKLDWPKNKLEVLLLLEEDDKETIEAAKGLKLPKYFKTLVVPHSLPKTKPKACNYGLAHSHGEFLVIYDAEDNPDPLQLKKAYWGFKNSKPNIACLQAKLNYYNPDNNLLTKFFTAEYSLWFDVVLPGLQSIETTIPLGGTSNHFRTKILKELKGWDAFNVTEDADLGTRLFKLGYRTAIIDSTTLEEANSHLGNWIRQRSRWIKGYIQTFLVHNRQPLKFIRSHGWHSLIFQLLMGGKIMFMLINPVLWLITISYFTMYQLVGPTIERLYPPIIFYMGAFSLVTGNFLCLYYYMIGCAKRSHWHLIKYTFLVPFYWLMISVAAMKAIAQLVVNPHYWEKTRHGLNLKLKKEEELSESTIEAQSLFLPNFIRNIIESKWSGGAGLVLASVIGNFLNFLYNIYLGNRLALEQFGSLSLFGSLLYIAQIVFSSIAAATTKTAGMAYGKHQRPVKKVWEFFTNYSLVVSIGISIPWLIFSPQLQTLFKFNDIEPLLIFLPVWIIGLLSGINNGFLSGSQRFGLLAVVVLIEPISKLWITIGLVQFQLDKLVYLSLPLSMFCGYLLSWYFANRITRFDSSNDEEKLRFPTKFVMVNALHKITTIVFLGLDIILAKILLSPEDAGRFALISLVGKMVFFFCGLISQFVMPLVSREEGAKGDPATVFNKLLISTSIASLAGFIGAGVLSRMTLPIILGSRAEMIVDHMLVYILGISAFSVASSISTYHLTREKYGLPIVSMLFSVGQLYILLTKHETLSSFTTALGLMGVFQLLLSLLIHRLTRYSVVIKQNTSAFLGLFSRSKISDSGSGSQIRFLILNWRDLKHVWAGGAEVYTQELAKHFVSEGHDVTIFCGNDGKCKTSETIDGVKIIRRGGFFTVYVWAMIYYIFKFHDQVDVIIDCENGVPFFTPLYSRRPKFLLIHHIHQKYFRENLSWPMKDIAGFLEGYLMPRVYHREKIITVSESSKADIIAMKPLQNKNVSVVNPGISLPELKLFPKKSTSPTLVYVGRVRPYKNIDVAIMAFEKVLVEFPDAVFKIAGSGESVPHLKKLVKERGLGKSVKFYGHVTDELREKLYKSAWLMIQPSTMEGWGITVIEANSCATPVIASNVSGLKDSVIDGKTGILVPPGNIDLFAKGIVKIFKNNSLRRKMALASVDRAKEFGWTNNASEFLSEIKKDLKSRYNFALGGISE